MPKRHLVFLIALSIISFYLLWFKLPFPGIDELMFKEPALSLIRGKGFSAPGLAAWPGMEKLGVSWYPPFYPLLLAAWFSIFGFSISSSLSFSLLICLASAYLMCLIWDEFDKGVRGSKSYAYLLIFFCWSVLLTEIHRPDPLLAVFGLSLVLLFIKNKEVWNLRYKMLLILLISLTLATSFGMGLLLMSYLFFLFLSLKQDKPKELVKFIVLFIFGLSLALLAWFLSAYPHYHTMMAQIYAFFNEGSLLKSLPHALPYIIDRHLREGFGAFYAPLLLYLLYFLLKEIPSTGNLKKSSPLAIRLIGIILPYALIIFKFPGKYYYLQFFYSFFIATLIFPILARVIEKRYNRVILSVFLLIALFPVFQSRLLIPLTWDKEDTYEYNRRKILEAVPGANIVIGSSVFWYMFGDDWFRDYWFRDLRLSDLRNCYMAKYILFSSGGSGKPDVPLAYHQYRRSYNFKEYFFKQLSTMSGEPNKLFGIPIAKSRWSYRFELYKRRQ